MGDEMGDDGEDDVGDAFLSDDSSFYGPSLPSLRP